MDVDKGSRFMNGNEKAIYNNEKIYDLILYFPITEKP